MLTPVILSGGSGTRLWPLSRELYPKQLLPLVGKGTMLQETLARLHDADAAAPIVVCNESHRFLVAEQLQQMRIERSTILLEPVGRNTAPAVAIAALAAPADAILLVLPADHVLRDVPAFRAAVVEGRRAAEAGKLVTFGVVARKPETGYGYIRREAGGGPVYPVAQFVEKPDLETAKAYVASGQYYWNSGMFMFSARRYLEELRAVAPAMHDACAKAFAAAKRDLDFTRLPKTEFEAIPGDAQGNVLMGDVLVADAHGCYLQSTSRLVAAVGLKDHVVVETKDAVMVAPKDRVQDVKALVNELKKQNRYETSLHREVFRPWGSYDSIDNGDRFQVKRLMVKPGASMSLQLHHHRAEHWIVVSGTARITRGEEVFLLEENQSTYIPVGTKHRIENPGMIPLHIIEVQSGSYLGEDDIVRFEDKYGREGAK